jgi:hypothetical protein
MVTPALARAPRGFALDELDLEFEAGNGTHVTTPEAADQLLSRRMPDPPSAASAG